MFAVQLILLSNEEMHFKNMPLVYEESLSLHLSPKFYASATSVAKTISFATPNVFTDRKCILNVGAKFVTALVLLFAPPLHSY